MNREIKFKAQRVDGKGWVYGCYVNSGHLTREGSKVHYILQDEGMCFDDVIEVIPETVCQFTGLKDKNGNEIYEGDELVYLITNVGYVKIETSGVCAVGFECFISNTNFHLTEITGNIHDKK